MGKTHGTRATYTSGCRCDECRNANNTYMSRYRRERTKPDSQHAWRNKRRWEDWEDELALDYSKTAWQIAETLERTPAAVAERRTVLNTLRTNQKEEEK